VTKCIHRKKSNKKAQHIVGLSVIILNVYPLSYNAPLSSGWKCINIRFVPSDVDGFACLLLLAQLFKRSRGC